jgi:hypothetical protein
MLYLPHCCAATDHKQAARFLLPEHQQAAAAAASPVGSGGQAGNDEEEGNVARWPVRSDYGLPEDLFVFSYLGPLACVSPPVLDAWCNILKRVPNSCLWLVRPASNAALPLTSSADDAGGAAEGAGASGAALTTLPSSTGDMDDGSVGDGSVGNGGGGQRQEGEQGGKDSKSVEANFLAEALVRGVKSDRFVFCDPPSGLAPDDFPWGNPSSSGGNGVGSAGEGGGGVDEAFGFSAGGSAAARRAEHLWRHKLSEVHLEPWGSGCAHGTSLGVADSLWAGTPAVALRGAGGASAVAAATIAASTVANDQGKSSGEAAAAAAAVAATVSEVGGAAGRVGAAALCAAGLSELAVANAWIYEETAVMLAVNDEKYMALRSKLEASRDELPLFDTAR